MRLGVVGSRDFGDDELVWSTLDWVHATYGITEIISGGARGPDRESVRWAKANNIPVTEHLADWEKHGRAAGYIRNHDIVTDSERILAFWDGVSKGTYHSITLARRHKIPRKIIYPL